MASATVESETCRSIATAFELRPSKTCSIMAKPASLADARVIAGNSSTTT